MYWFLSRPLTTWKGHKLQSPSKKAITEMMRNNQMCVFNFTLSCRPMIFFNVLMYIFIGMEVKTVAQKTVFRPPVRKTNIKLSQFYLKNPPFNILWYLRIQMERKRILRNKLNVIFPKSNTMLLNIWPIWKCSKRSFPQLFIQKSTVDSGEWGN